MRRGLFLVIVAGAWAASIVSIGSQSAAPTAASQEGTQPPDVRAPVAAAPAAVAAANQAVQFRAVLDRSCVTCHNTRLNTAGLTLETVDLTSIGRHAESLEKVVRRLRAGTMPPVGMPRPQGATYDAMASWLEGSLEEAARANPNPGRPALYRLNRAEYTNAVRDLLALDVDASVLLPADDSSFGFDNLADVLSVSPALQERYLSAAGKVAALAVGDPAIGMFDEITEVPEGLTQTQHVDGLPLGTRGGILVTRTFPADGEYWIRVTIFRTNEGNQRGINYPHRMIMTVDGAQVFEASIGGPEDQKLLRSTNPSITGDNFDARMQVRLPITAGEHAVGVTFVQKSEAEQPDILQPFLATFDHIERDGVPKVNTVRITGPYNPTGPGDTASRRRIFTCRPAQESDEAGCARTILSALTRGAYRRPVTDADMVPVLRFYTEGRKKGTFDAGIQLALRYVLASPEFTFRIERDPVNVAPGAAFRLTDVELASRLAAFLWSSIPDEELIDAARQGRLKNPATLERQVRRMLADPRADALTTNFAGQWLYLRNLRSVRPDLNEFPDFDDNLRAAMRRETEMLFESIMREDRSAIDLLVADYTFVNERLAKHYGIPKVYGSHFRRVPVPSEARRGLLGQGSVLTVTSRAERTSPVLRGKWILENIFGTPPPPPPPNVPALEDAKDGERKPKTVREQMEVHRRNPQCASCHNMMDPLGFALENFDAVGAWRDHQEGTPIDAAGQLADGTKVNGVVGLRQALMRRPEGFVRTMTEKLMTYALGRGLVHYDMPTVRTIVRDAASTNYRFSSLVLGIAKSPAFEMKVKALPEPVATSTRQ